MMVVLEDDLIERLAKVAPEHLEGGKKVSIRVKWAVGCLEELRRRGVVTDNGLVLPTDDTRN